jgi:hypothetical protein
MPSALEFFNRPAEFDWETYYADLETCLVPEDKVMFWHCPAESKKGERCGHLNASVVGSKARCVKCNTYCLAPQPIYLPVL